MNRAPSTATAAMSPSSVLLLTVCFVGKLAEGLVELWEAVEVDPLVESNEEVDWTDGERDVIELVEG